MVEKDTIQVSEESTSDIYKNAVKYYPETGQVEMVVKYPDQPLLWNEDFHPTPVNLRNWGAGTFAALWFGMAFIVASWSLVSLGLVLGLNITLTLILDFVGSVIVLIPMILQSHGGARYGLAETQLTRTRWGTFGAWLPSWIRAIISMGWWGIETYILAEAASGIYVVLSGNYSILNKLIASGSYGPATIAAAYPSIFWGIFIIAILAQIVLFYFSPPTKAQPALKWFARIAAPLIAIAFILIWVPFMAQARFNFTPIFSIPTTVSGTQLFISALVFTNAVVAFWATMAMSMPDYTRFSKSQKAQIYGQIPMPFYMLIVGFLGATATGAAMTLYHTQIWDPILLTVTHVSAIYTVPALILILISTFAVNTFANTVAPGYDIANSLPKRLSWFRGVVIGIIISLIIGAYSFYGSAYSYLYTWLLTYGGLLGVVEGVLVLDYVVIRRMWFNPNDAFRMHGDYTYWKGINPAAIIAFIITTILIYVPSPIQPYLFDGSWISGFVIAGLIDIILMKYWIIPKYQPFLKGGLLMGYMDEHVLAFKGK
ncbi:MAG: cytosine permease [Conexivisphaerales archaeon]